MTTAMPPGAKPPASPEITVSGILAEARVDSISDLFSKDPESYTTEDLPRLVATLRQQAERFKTAEANGTKPKGKSAVPEMQKASASLEDMGL